MHVLPSLGKCVFAARLLVVSVSLSHNFLSREHALTKFAPPLTDVPDRRFFVWLSDVHVDPYYSSDSAVCVSEGGGIPGGQALPEGTMGCDPPMSLWMSAVEAAAELGQGAAFVLHTGDSVRHLQDRMPEPAQNVTSILRGVATALRGAFPWLGPNNFVVGSPGNDDTPRNYQLKITTDSPVNPWLANMARTWSESGVMAESARAYSYGGFFETEVGGLRILSINTLIYSVLHQPFGPSPLDPFGQLAWLRSRLQQSAAEGRRAWIIGHIPPGTETYSYTPLWKSDYVQAYLDIVEDPVLGSVIAAQLFGHVHADEFRILPRAPPGAGPVLLTGALSPVYNGNPSFRLVEYDGASGQLLNVKVFWAEMPSGTDSFDWQFGYDYLSVYPILREAVESDGGLTNGAFSSFKESLWQSWLNRGEEFSIYADWYKTRVRNDLKCCTLLPDLTSVLSFVAKQGYMAMYSCGLEVSTDEELKACAMPHFRDAFATWYNASLSEDWPNYREARRSLWKQLATEREQKEVERGCGHMVSIARSAFGQSAR